MTEGHAQAALDLAEGAERAQQDFKAGLTTNPFTGRRLQAIGWDRQTAILVCVRDHGAVLDRCCWEHDRHVGGRRANRYQWGIGSCAACRAEADVERERQRRAAVSDV